MNKFAITNLASVLVLSALIGCAPGKRTPNPGAPAGDKAPVTSAKETTTTPLDEATPGTVPGADSDLAGQEGKAKNVNLPLNVTAADTTRQNDALSVLLKLDIDNGTVIELNIVTTADKKNDDRSLTLSATTESTPVFTVVSSSKATCEGAQAKSNDLGTCDITVALSLIKNDNRGVYNLNVRRLPNSPALIAKLNLGKEGDKETEVKFAEGVATVNEVQVSNPAIAEDVLKFITVNATFDSNPTTPTFGPFIKQGDGATYLRGSIGNIPAKDEHAHDLSKPAGDERSKIILMAKDAGAFQISSPVKVGGVDATRNMSIEIGGVSRVSPPALGTNP